MRIHVSRRKEIEDVRKEITKLKNKNNEKLEELKKVEKAYEESGEIYYSERETSQITLKKFRNIFTKQRLNLLKEVNDNTFNSISEISRYLKRNIKNVYDDLKILEKFKLIKLEKQGKETKPKNVVESITIEFFDN